MVKQDLLVAAIKWGLATQFIGQQISYHPRLTSTMEAAREQARLGVPEGTVIIAGEQTRGRGRLKHTWFSPEGNIALSIILYPDSAGLPYLIMIASLAVSSAIESVTGLKAQIKWPNDILIMGKKVAGILIENEMKGDKAITAVIGIGINVTLRHDEVIEISAIATGLEEQLGVRVSREEIIRTLFTYFERLYLKLPDAGPIFKAWRDRLITIGQKVKVTGSREILEGTAESVDETGALLLRRADGALTRVVAGDITLSEK